MKLCTETITVVNKIWDDSKGCDVYVGTVIRGVSWHSQTAANVDSEGLHAANSVVIRIPVDANFNRKAYVDPITYKTSDPARSWTLEEGDSIVHGKVDFIITSPAELREQFPEVVTVLGVTDNRRAPHGKHWKITAG